MAQERADKLYLKSVLNDFDGGSEHRFVFLLSIASYISYGRVKEFTVTINNKFTCLHPQASPAQTSSYYIATLSTAK